MKNVFKQAMFLAMVLGFAGQACAQTAVDQAKAKAQPKKEVVKKKSAKKSSVTHSKHKITQAKKVDYSKSRFYSLE